MIGLERTFLFGWRVVLVDKNTSTYQLTTVVPSLTFSIGRRAIMKMLCYLYRCDLAENNINNNDGQREKLVNDVKSVIDEMWPIRKQDFRGSWEHLPATSTVVERWELKTYSQGPTYRACKRPLVRLMCCLYSSLENDVDEDYVKVLKPGAADDLCAAWGTKGCYQFDYVPTSSDEESSDEKGTEELDDKENSAR